LKVDYRKLASPKIAKTLSIRTKADKIRTKDRTSSSKSSNNCNNKSSSSKSSSSKSSSSKSSSNNSRIAKIKMAISKSIVVSDELFVLQMAFAKTIKFSKMLPTKSKQLLVSLESR